MQFKITALALFSLVLSTQLFAQSLLVRGPYLNVGTSESVVVRWRTTADEIGEVKYGTDFNNLNLSVTENDSTTEHELTISGLNPETKYYYSIGTNGNIYSTNDDTYFFKTSPEIGTEGNYRFWVLGDFGNGSQAQKDVKTGFLNNYTDIHTDGWIWLGDNAYGDGTDQEFQDKVFEVYPEVLKNTVVWPCPGNHDYGSIDLSNNGPYYENFTMPTNGEAGGEPSGEEGHYSFDYGNVHFLSLNTEWLPWILTDNNDFTDWLEEDLQNTEADFVVAFWHQPAYSKGTHDSDDDFRPQLMRNNVLPIIEEYGVDLVLAGHSHSYERSYLINGHYGNSGSFDPQIMLLDGSNGNKDQGNAYVKTEADSSFGGTVYATVGCGGQKGDGSHDLNHPVMYMSTEDYHGSMVIDVSGLEMTCKFIDTTGAVLDEFTIKKGASIVGVPEKTFDHNIFMNAYPNPFKKSFNIEFSLPKAEKIELNIYDVNGKLIANVARGKYNAGDHRIVYTPEEISTNGIYLVEIHTEEKLAMKRLIRME